MKRTKETINYQSKDEDMARYAKALGHPLRIAILHYLDQQSSCLTGDLVDVFPLAQSTISQHLKELKKAGLIKGEVNPPKVKYCIDQEEWAKAKTLFCNFFDIEFEDSSCTIC